MTKTRRRTESEHHRGADAAPHDRVEVFDTNPNSNTNADPVANPFGNTQREALNNLQSDPGFGNADLHNARVVTGNSEPTTLRTTDLRDSELNTTATGNANHTDIGAAGQGANWGTILMVIAIILVIILLGSWLF